MMMMHIVCVCTVGTRHFYPPPTHFLCTENQAIIHQSALTQMLITCNIDSVHCSHMYVGIENLKDITSYLNPLDKTAIIHLGIVLGLNFNRLKTVMDTPTFLDEMLAGWLQRVDQVLQTGSPTWSRMVEALKDPRVGQNGLASKIEQDKQLISQNKQVN